MYGLALTITSVILWRIYRNGFFSSYYSQFYVGSMYEGIRLAARSNASYTNSPFPLIPPLSLTLPNYRLLRHPLCLIPCTFTSSAFLPVYCSYLLIASPFHSNLLSWTFFAISPTFVVPLFFHFLSCPAS